MEHLIWDNIMMRYSEIDYQTGSLTTRNIRTTDSGLHFIRLVKSLAALFNITVCDKCLNLMFSPIHVMPLLKEINSSSHTLFIDLQLLRICFIIIIRLCFYPLNIVINSNWILKSLNEVISRFSAALPIPLIIRGSSQCPSSSSSGSLLTAGGGISV